MERHGFGGKTFTVETYADGTPVVHYMEGQYPEERYYKYEMTAFEECRTHFQDSQHVYLIVIDLSVVGRCGGGPNYQQGKSIDVKSYRTHSMPAIIVDSLRVLP